MIVVGPIKYKILQLMNRGYSFHNAAENVLGMTKGTANKHSKLLRTIGIIQNRGLNFPYGEWNRQQSVFNPAYPDCISL